MREELGQGQGKFHLDIRETDDLHVPDRQSTFWHERSPFWPIALLAWAPTPGLGRGRQRAHTRRNAIT